MTNIKRIKFFIKGLIFILNQKLRKKSFQYYSDQYWNDLPQIQNYINQSTTDNPDVTWIEDILTRFKECLPFENVLIVGCGNGWLERQLYDLGIGKSFDAFDISDSHLKLAKKLVENRSINYFKDDINNLKNLTLKNYDAIFNVGVLHHVFRLSKTIWELNKTLKKNGLMFNFEYVGPSYNQYSNEHVKIIKQINNSLPSRFKTIIPVRPKLINFKNGEVTFAEGVFEHIIDKLTCKEKGVRNLKRCLEIIYSKLNLFRLMEKDTTLFEKEEFINVEFPFEVTIEIVDKLIKQNDKESIPFGMYM